MAYLISHFFPGGTEEQYRSVLAAAHPSADGLPQGQTYHAAGPTDGGWLIVAVWDSKADFDQFVADKLMPALQSTDGAFEGRPQQHVAEVANLIVG